MYNHVLSGTGSETLNARRDAKTSNAFELYAQYFSDRNNPAALGRIQGPVWVDSPEIRGTSAILWSCILTIIACVYTALHLNIPPKGGFWRVLLIKIKWVITALLVPEVMIYMSIVQFLRARLLQRHLIRELRKLRGKRYTGMSGGRRLPPESSIDLRLCFFIDMGGISIRPKLTQIEWVEDEGNSDYNSSMSLEQQNTECKLTPDGVYQLLRMGHWFPVTSDSIDDKSKATNFQKALVLLQVGWFAVQCIARKAYGLPLFLLEIHTVVHVATAAIMYGFWFEKPLDIREPEVWDDTTGGALEFHILIWLLSPSVMEQLHQIAIHKGSGYLNYRDRDIIGCGLRNIYIDSVLPRGQTKPRDIEMTYEVAKKITGSDVRYLTYIAKYIKKHHKEHIRSGRNNQRLSTILGRICGHKYRGTVFQMSSRHNLIVEETFDGNLRDHEKRKDVFSAFGELTGLLLRYGRGDGSGLFQRYNILLTILLPAIYGGIHLAAWNAAYPTRAEHLMWTYACVAIMTSLPDMLLAYILVGKFTVLYEAIKKTWYGWVLGDFLPLVLLLGYCLIFAGTVLLISARCFIIIESFISLRTAPIGIYWTPAWIQMFPHV